MIFELNPSGGGHHNALKSRKKFDLGKLHCVPVFASNGAAWQEHLRSEEYFLKIWFLAATSNTFINIFALFFYS